MRTQEESIDVSPEFAKLCETLRARQRTQPLDSVEQFRWGVERDALPVDEEINVERGSISGVPLERIAAPGPEPTQTVVYLHGGGYVMGSCNTHRKLCGELARATRATILLIDYPLAPESPFPAAVLSISAIYRALLQEGVSPQSIAIVGDSAGGGLAVATLIYLRDSGIRLPAATAVISPWVDLLRAGRLSQNARSDPLVRVDELEMMREWYLAGADPRHPLASPIYADLSLLPPLLIQVGGAELLLEDSVALLDRAVDCGVQATLEIWPAMVHVWHAFCGRVPEASAAIRALASYLGAQWGESDFETSAEPHH